jgi:hypothetical protein
LAIWQFIGPKESLVAAFDAKPLVRFLKMNLSVFNLSRWEDHHAFLREPEKVTIEMVDLRVLNG